MVKRAAKVSIQTVRIKAHVLVAIARFYDDIADELVRGATAVLATSGASWEMATVPGAFEIPAALRFASVRRRRRFDGYVALGCVIRGETSHYDYVCGESARGLQDLAVQHGLAIGYGILTVDTKAQAWERAKVDRLDKGGDAARACLAMVALKRQFRRSPR
ncbi:MAG: 6,7-dimethyl-8-ribityllumazine synthase [Proteobacteria bacterium]|nr:6,7-dimethyl-8-ribityllumazine synthase [Pseudomonadota bacterium]MBI3496025.1 6,7-dimethyl-8-ribityllumazine synthase [Pseudomonadota bacterium]